MPLTVMLILVICAFITAIVAAKRPLPALGVGDLALHRGADPRLAASIGDHAMNWTALKDKAVLFLKDHWLYFAIGGGAFLAGALLF